MNNIIKVISILIGTIIGAGFASGKEIYVFFKIFGSLGIVGIIVSTILTGLIIYSVLYISKKKYITSNENFLDTISNNKIDTIQKTTKMILKNIINVFLIISFFIMVAGWSSYFKQKYGIAIFITAGIMGILLYLTFLNNIDGIMKISSYIVPVLIVIILFIAYKNIALTDVITFPQTTAPVWYVILNAIIYSSYNSIMLIPILISVSETVKNAKEIKIIAIITSIILLILSLCIFQILNLAQFDINNVELPILEILSGSTAQETLYSIVVIIAIFTTAVSAGYGFLENIKDKTKYKKVAGLICLLSIPISYLGFGKLINIMYPLFGAIAMYQIILIFKKYSIAKNSKNWYNHIRERLRRYKIHEKQKQWERKKYNLF